MKVSKGLIIGGAVAAFFLVIIMTVFTSFVSAKNFGNASEQRIKAKYKDNENVLAQYGQKMMEVAQVPSMARKDGTALASSAMSGRYGADGSKATFQWIQEQNPSIDPQLYRKIQQLVESGRDEFKNSQTQILEICRSYETTLGSFWQGFWLGAAGYPKVDLNEYCNIVSTDRAAEAFKTKREGVLDLSGSSK